MIFRTHFLPVILCAGSMLLAQPLRAQPPSLQTWDLPHGTAVKDSGPRTWHFSVVYYSANRTGDVIHVPAHPVKVRDVSGAGDTVIATFAALLAAGLTPRQALPAANRAGGLVVEKFGTAGVSYDELFA